MPRRKMPLRLEELCLERFSGLCSKACTLMEELEQNLSGGGDDIRKNPTNPDMEKKLAEAKFSHLIRMLPSSVLEVVIPSVVKDIAGIIRKKRSHKGLLKALEHLPQSSLRRFDTGGLVTEVRLYGQVNMQCKMLLTKCIPRLKSLTHLNLYTKCNDDMLYELARHCGNLQDLHVPMSDITDRGLMALAGISVNGPLTPNGGCFKLNRISVQNCDHITQTGVACVLRNLPNILNLSYDKLADAIEMVAKIDGDFLSGKRNLKITHVDQFSDYYEFDIHPDIVYILKSVCPKLESLRFYVSDDGCRTLSQFSSVKHLQLETEDLGPGFSVLIENYSSLVTLQLTFRYMTSAQLNAIAENCPHLSILRLIGFEITRSETLATRLDLFGSLKILDIRMVRQVDPYEEEEINLETGDTVTPQLLHYLLDTSHNLEELTIQAVGHFVNEAFLVDLVSSNPLMKMAKLKLSITPEDGLNLRAAKYLISSLPVLQTLALSRWNISGREFRQLLYEVRDNNLDIVFA